MSVMWLTEDEMTPEMRREIDLALRSDVYRAERDANFFPEWCVECQRTGKPNHSWPHWGR